MPLHTNGRHVSVDGKFRLNCDGRQLPYYVGQYKKPHRGFTHYVNSHCHPSGVDNMDVMSFRSVEEAQEFADINNPLMIDVDEALAYAEKVLTIVEATDDDSFSITNAIRMLEDYEVLTKRDRVAIMHAVNNLIKG